MRTSKPLKPATARHGEPASKTEQLGGQLKVTNTLDDLRAQYLSEVFALPADTAVTIAELAFGGDR